MPTLGEFLNSLVPGTAVESEWLLIAASILAARKLDQFDAGKRGPAAVAAISDAVRWAEEIMRERLDVDRYNIWPYVRTCKLAVLAFDLQFLRSAIPAKLDHFRNAGARMGTLQTLAETDERRLLLFSTRLRFMPQVQPIRETAINKIIEQNLLLADRPLSVSEIEKQCLDLNGRSVLSRNDIEVSLRQLANTTLIVTGMVPPFRYCLTDERRQELWSVQADAEKTYTTIVSRLFKGVPAGPTRYSEPFLECLSLIFSRLGETYVRHIKHEVSASELLGFANISRAVADVTKELFGDASFYIDTNVLVHALDTSGRHHHSFKMFTQACAELGIRLLVSRISIDEMRRVAALEKELLNQRVNDRIPPELVPRTRGILLPAFLQEMKTNGSCDLDELFEKFDKPSEHLRSDYGIEVVDDEWFLKAVEDAATLQLVDEVKAAYDRVKAAYCPSSRRKKGERAALHDALMIGWIEKERDSTHENTWFVTLDTSLPVFKDEHDNRCRPYALTLVGLMQWLSPVTNQRMNDDQAAAMFSEALKQQLLPHETFFELRDFLVFSQMQIETELLPAKDVEACIRTIKENAPDLDPTNPRDRERLSHEISKFFVDPGRQYKAHLQEHHERIDQLTSDFDSHKSATIIQVTALKGQVKDKDSEIIELRNKLRTSELSGEAKFRLSLIGIGLLLSLAAMAYLIFKFGEGANAFQKFTKEWSWFAVVTSAWIVSSWFVVGKERLVMLGWPFTKLLRIESGSANNQSAG